MREGRSVERATGCPQPIGACWDPAGSGADASGRIREGEDNLYKLWWWMWGHRPHKGAKVIKVLGLRKSKWLKRAGIIGYATAYTGADHCRSYAFQEVFGDPIPWEVDRFGIDDKGKLTTWNQDVRTSTLDCAPMCAFLLDMAVPDTACQNTATLMEAVTGLVFTAEDVLKVGEQGQQSRQGL